MDRYNGLLPVLKEAGITSHDVIYRLRRIIGAGKVGHTGTLDPMASGLLLICLGRGTKLTQFLTDWDKTYLAEMTLGMVSDTLDGDGQLSAGGDVPDLSEDDIWEILSRFTGKITQKVPAYSAVKVQGRELYKYARKGVEIDSPEREVEITGLDLVNSDLPRLSLLVHCSKGTYIRVLADDIGREIGCGGYLSKLERRKVGPFDISQAMTLAEVEAEVEAGILEKRIVPIEQALDFPVIKVRNQARQLIKNGGLPPTEDILGHSGDFVSGDLISMADEDGEIMAIGKTNCDTDAYRARPKKDFFSYVRVLI